MTDKQDRRPRSVYSVGDEPDARFSLANERTALSWVRTGLSLVAGGIALASLATVADLSAFLDIIGAVACLAGGGFAVYALFTWHRNERAIRQNTPLPTPIGLPVLVVFVFILALLLVGYVAEQST